LFDVSTSTEWAKIYRSALNNVLLTEYANPRGVWPVSNVMRNRYLKILDAEY